MVQATLNKQLNGSSPLSLEAVLKLLEQYPELSAEWLLRGTGTMEHSTLELPSVELMELQAVVLDQAREIFRLKQQLGEYDVKKGNA